MNAAIVKKIAIVLSILVAVILISIGCNLLTQDKQPTISNPNKPLLTLGDITVTRGEFYERAKVLEGLTQFILLTDERILADYILAITSEEFEEEMKRIKYGTTDQDVIDDLTEDELAEIENDFRLSLTLAGFNPDDDEALERFVKLNLSKYKASLDFMEDLSGDEIFTVAENFYKNQYAGDRIAIQLLFATQAEYISVMKHFGLVPYLLDVEVFDAGLRRFTGSQEELMRLSTVEAFDDDNTEILTEAEAFVMYVKMFDYLYPWRDSLGDLLDIDGAFDYEDFDLALFSQTYFNYEYNAMITDNVKSSATQILYGIALVNEDEEDETPIIPYMSVSAEYSNVDPHRSHRVMYFVLDEKYFPSFQELPAEPGNNRQRELIDEYLEALMESDEELISEVMMILRENEGMIIHDQRLALAYEFKYGNDLYVKSKDSSIIASFYDFTISTDDYLDYLVKRIGAMYLVEIYKEHFLFESDYYVNVFDSTNRDVLRTNSEKIGAYRYSLTLLRQQFSAGQALNTYGMSTYDWWNDPFGRWHPMNYDFSDMLYLDPMYQFHSDYDALRSLAVQNLLVPYLYDHLDFDSASTYMQEQLDNYFSLAVEHLIVALDFDENLSPDDFDEFMEELEDDPVRLAEFEDFKDRLAVLIIEASEFQTLLQIATEFRNAPRGKVKIDGYTAYSINYVLNGGTNDPVNKYFYRVSSSPIPLSAPTKTGYTFLGWYDNDEFTGDIITEISADAEEAFVLYAKWEVVGYEVTYHLNGGINHVDNPATYEQTDPDFTLLNPTKLGYTFLGWYDNADFTGPVVTEILTGSTGDKTLHAKWEIIPGYSEIEYVLDGGINDADNPLAYNAVVTLLDPVKHGYTFLGWYDNDDFTGDAITEITADPVVQIDLYAKWEIISNLVSYVLYGGINASGNPISYEVTDSTKTINQPTRTFFVFDGWYDNDDFTGDEIVEITSGSSGHVTLHAKWIYTDYSKWAEFKNYGFTIRHEVLSNVANPLNYNNSKNFVPEFVVELQRLYGILVLEDEAVVKTLDDNFFSTVFGLHLVQATKSTTDFATPSAIFANEDVDYDVRWINDADLPNMSQMLLWAARQKDMRTGITDPLPDVPESVDKALTLLFGGYHNRFYPTQGLDISGNLQMVTMLLEGDAVFAIQDEHLTSMLENMKTLYENLLYP